MISDIIKLEDIDFKKYDSYDASKVNCLNFNKKGDLRNGKLMDFGNMVSGYPFIVNGYKFLNSETAFIAGLYYSNNNELHKKAQEELSSCKFV